MTEVNEVCSMGLTFDPGECLSPLSVPFCSPSHYGCLFVCWLFFPFIVFPGSGESCRDMCECEFVWMSWKYSIQALAPALYRRCPFLTLIYSMFQNIRGLPYKWLRYYQPHFKQYGVLACWLLMFITFCNWRKNNYARPSCLLKDVQMKSFKKLCRF